MRSQMQTYLSLKCSFGFSPKSRMVCLESSHRSHKSISAHDLDSNIPRIHKCNTDRPSIFRFRQPHLAPNGGFVASPRAGAPGRVRSAGMAPQSGQRQKLACRRPAAYGLYCEFTLPANTGRSSLTPNSLDTGHSRVTAINAQEYCICRRVIGPGLIFRTTLSVLAKNPTTGQDVSSLRKIATTCITARKSPSS